MMLVDGHHRHVQERSSSGLGQLDLFPEPEIFSTRFLGA
jgi:hypothetical protein